MVILIIEEELYIANVGDSRAVLSKNFGETVVQVTLDHKPSEEEEQKRIVIAGGKVYQ